MSQLVRALGVLLVIFAIVVYARDCRMAFNQWKHYGDDPGQPGILGEYISFDWRPAGIFSDILYFDGKPVARLVKYHFHLADDTIEIESLDGTKHSRYCGK